VGDFEAWALAQVESTLKYHPEQLSVLTRDIYHVLGRCQVGSLTGAVASQRVTEAHEGTLRLSGNQL
jgi:hypothetical protein